MNRRFQIVGAAGAAILVFGFALWALASSNLPGRLQMALWPDSETTRPEQPKPRAERPAVEVAGVLAIEIARIDAGGASVLAGRSPPNHRVTVLANGREIASVDASDEGQWSAIINDGIAAGPLKLSLTSRPRDGGPAVIGTARQLTVPAPSASSKVAALPANSKVASPATTPKIKTAPSPHAAAGDAADKRALADFEALVARARSEMGTARTPRPSAAGDPKPRAIADSPASAPSPAPSTAVAAAPPISGAARPASDAIPDAAQVPIPVPITFTTDDTTLTADGARAAALLAEYLRIKRPEGISLSGHADSRGPDSYNMELSRQRLEVIERYLRAAGYKGQLSLLPRGKREPYRGVDRGRLSVEQIHQVDRRVELRITP